MKTSFRFFIVAMIVLATSCEKEEMNFKVDETPKTALTGRILSCGFAPDEVSTITGGAEGFVNGSLNRARFSVPGSIVFDENRQITYVAEWGNHAIRAIKGNKVITLVGGIEGDREGKGSEARLQNPSGMVLDRLGNIYVVDGYNHKIRKVTPEGKMTTFAGSTRGYANGQSKNAQFNYPYGITLDEDGTFYVTDRGNAKIRSITANGTVGYVSGSTNGLRNSDSAEKVQFNGPRGITIGKDGALYVADSNNNMIRKVSKELGQTITFAGTGRWGKRDDTRARASFARPDNIVCDREGNFFIVDTYNSRIRFISGNQVENLTGSYPGNLDGSYDEAIFRYPLGIAILNDNLFVADNHTIRRITMEYDCD